MTTNNLAGKTYRAFSDAFFTALVAAISDASGSPWLVAVVPDEQSTADESEPVRINLTLEGNLPGKCLQQAAGQFGTEQSEALLKCVEAAMSKFCSAVAEDYGTFTSQASIASEPASDNANVAEATAVGDGGDRVSLLMYLNPALAEALSLQAEKTSATNEKSKKAVGEKEGQPPEQLNLQLVMDVELIVTLRFGQRQLALREVLELTSGSVIELDRQVEEPIELLLEGKVIARGEAVVIDGNYGLRVTEVPQPISSQVLR
jgi:flagellar motor switch protein FliN/FliY